MVQPLCKEYVPCQFLHQALTHSRINDQEFLRQLTQNLSPLDWPLPLQLNLVGFLWALAQRLKVSKVRLQPTQPVRVLS